MSERSFKNAHLMTVDEMTLEIYTQIRFNSVAVT